MHCSLRIQSNHKSNNSIRNKSVTLTEPPELNIERLPTEILIFNVGGTRFELDKIALEQAPNSLLGNEKSRKRFFNSKTKEYYIRHDPQLFRYISLFYLTGSLHYPRNECVQLFEETLKFFGLSPEWISECCLEEFEDGKHVLSERDTYSETDSLLNQELLEEEIMTRLRRCSTKQDFTVASTEIAQRLQVRQKDISNGYYNEKNKTNKHNKSQSNLDLRKLIGNENPLPQQQVEKNERQVQNMDYKNLIKNWRPTLWQAFENPRASTLAVLIYYVTGFFITVSVLANIAETMGSNKRSEITGAYINYGELYASTFNCLDCGCVVIFTIEYIARLLAAPNRWKFFKSYMSIIDVVAIMPFYLSLILPNNSVSDDYWIFPKN